MSDEMTISASGLSDAEIRTQIAEAITRTAASAAARAGGDGAAPDGPPTVLLQGATGRDALLMDLGMPVHLHVDASVGDYAFAHNRIADVRVDGNVGDGVGEGMVSGAVRIRGNAGLGAGTAMSGGTLAIYGSAGAMCGAAMRGGELFVRGDVGHGAGSGSLWGTIVIGGDAAEGLGDQMRGSTIFIRGKAAVLGRGVREAPLREREKLRLGLLLINAGIRGDVKEFRRIVSEITIRGDAAKQSRGELNPSWR